MTIFAELALIKAAVATIESKIDSLSSTGGTTDLTPVLDAISAIDTKIGTEEVV